MFPWYVFLCCKRVAFAVKHFEKQNTLNKATRKYINWLFWKHLTIWKEYRGEGFRHFYNSHLAMIGKQVSNQDTIISEVFKAKYYPKERFSKGEARPQSHWIWEMHKTRIRNFVERIIDNSHLQVQGDLQASCVETQSA